MAIQRHGLLGPRRSAITTYDAGEACTHLSRLHRTAVHVDCLGAGSQSAECSYSRTEFAHCATDHVVQRGEVLVRFHRLASTMIVWTVAGRLECTRDGDTHVAGPGDLLLVTGEAALVARLVDATLTITTFATTVFAAATPVGQRPGGDAYVRFTGVRPVSPTMALAWKRTLGYVQEAILAEPEVATPSMLGGATRLLAETALAAFPHRVETGGCGGAADDLPELVRRATDFIEQNAARSIGVVDVAAAVFVTPRRVQHVFKQYLDTTPTAYLRLVRLRRVHEELVTADRSTTTVTATAARWGFGHTGRFAVVYRQAFGESPHETLRGRAPGLAADVGGSRRR